VISTVGIESQQVTFQFPVTTRTYEPGSRIQQEHKYFNAFLPLLYHANPGTWTEIRLSFGLLPLGVDACGYTWLEENQPAYECPSGMDEISTQIHPATGTTFVFKHEGSKHNEGINLLSALIFSSECQCESLHFQ
jgi:hypothetical protein